MLHNNECIEVKDSGSRTVSKTVREGSIPSSSAKIAWCYRLVVKSLDFQSGNTGPIPVSTASGIVVNKLGEDIYEGKRE